MATPPQRPRFRLEFRVLSDGLDTAKAQALTAAGAHAHRGQFPSFALLPPELRLKIWELLLAPRIVAIACLDSESPDSDEEPPEPWTSFPSLQAHPPPSATPVLLHVNRETRALALAHYAPAFSWKVPHVLLHGSYPSSSSTWSQPRVWFNYAQDAVYLLGELEPCDSYGFNSPMAYFLDREEALRVRRLAVALGALRFGEAGSQHIFGALFHVVDRFAKVGGRVLVAVVPRDEFTHHLMGGEDMLVRGEGEEDERRRGADDVNMVQKIWRDWYRGSIVTSSLANVQFELVRESDLPEHIAKPIQTAVAGS
ncbi:hypothetical protein F5Y04DRAFT_254695 [Hypomontagnella monticulosa]|nr:hypothetical protein F5Y04DRAFT_254695 [Hypomontagnella monticulosa]